MFYACRHGLQIRAIKSVTSGNYLSRAILFGSEYKRLLVFINKQSAFFRPSDRKKTYRFLQTIYQGFLSKKEK